MAKYILPFALCLLTGCTTVQDTVGFNSAHPPAGPTGAFDGSYFGQSNLVRTAQGAQCPRSRTGVAEVADKRLSFAYAPEVIFNPPIQPDGTFHDMAGAAALDGRIVKDSLVMKVTTPQCETHYQLGFTGNHS